MMSALRAGSPHAFSALVSHYQSTLTRVARLFVHTTALAEEVVQETWLSVWRGLPGFDDRTGIDRWLLGILRNKARSHWRRSARRRRLASSNGRDGDLLQLFLEEHHGNWAKQWALSERHWPEGCALASETVARLERAMDALPPRQREVVWLRDVEGLSSDETKRALGLSDANQRVLLHRARSRLRSTLSGSERQALDFVRKPRRREL